MNALLLSFAAGLLTTLSPCVLPLLPMVLAGAASRSRLGPLVLVGASVLTSAGLGLALATLARGAALDPEIFHKVGAVLIALMGLVLFTPPLQAALSISREAYQAAAASGKPLVIYVKADWCPVCAKETPVIQHLMQDPAFKDYQVLVVDFDNNKQALQMLHVDRQSTIIVSRGAKAIDRATGLTDATAIRTLIAKAG